ncbi:helix-turn-helix transcriptional regulator [Melittangium boletus]|uniref:helix-turn-helix transcriptional regulator n=1 Tax=Melittangium boletus TaxID=83453 RepID=UPI003DA4A5E9
MPSHLSPGVREQLAESLRDSLRTARLGAALSQQEMARRIGVGVSTYMRLERGKMAPGPDTLRRLGQTLCLSLDALVGPACAAAVGLEAPRRPARRRRTRAPRKQVLPLLLLVDVG